MAQILLLLFRLPAGALHSGS